MIDEQAHTLSTYRMGKAKTLLVQAELLFANHQYDGSVNVRIMPCLRRYAAS